MKIIILAHFAGSPRHGMVFGHYYLAREWIKAGHEVTIVAASYSHVRATQPRRGSDIADEMIEGIRYVWIPTPHYEPHQIGLRVLNMLSYSVRCFLRDFGPADLVVCSSHHPFAIHAARRMARRRHARLVFEVRDLWPMTLINLGRASASHLFIKAMQFSEDYAYRHADKVVSVLPRARDYMVSRGMQPEKFVYVPNGVGADDVGDGTPLRPDHAARLDGQRKLGRRIVGYAGRLGEANALTLLADAVAMLADDTIVIAVLGHGPNLPALKQRVARLGLDDRFLFLDSVPKAQVVDFLARIDIAYIGLVDSGIFRHGVSPTKLSDYMLAAKPILCAINAPENPVELSGSGVVCMPVAADVASALASMMRMTPAELERVGVRGKQWILENRDYPTLARRFLEAVIVD